MSEQVDALVHELEESLHAEAEVFLDVRFHGSRITDGKPPTEEEARMQTRLTLREKRIALPEVLRWRLRALVGPGGE